jgi:predicted membrane-bound dolichyl-phosphate-mannose-protein mannosyltransferase
VSVATEATVASPEEDTRAPASRWGRLRSSVTGPGAALGLILVATVVTRVAWLNRPDKSLVFDEAYYVNAARRLLDLTVPSDAPYADAPAGLDPNSEHPPLGKVVIAASMRLFGDNPVGWRSPSILAGLVVILAVYLLVRATGHSAWLAVYAAGVAMLDNLLLVHSRIATLDVLFLAPLLVAALLTLRRQWIWAGVACGIALLVKVPALFGLVGLLVLVLVMPGGGRLRDRAGRAAVLGVVATVVATAGLWFLDARFTRFDNPVSHARFIQSYGLDLSRTGGPVNSESEPWQWLVNEVQITYLRVDTNEVVGEEVVTTKPSTWFRGAMNPVLPGVALTALFYTAWLWVRRRDPLAAWCVVWSASVFVPYLALSVISHRISYLFYALPLLPAYAVAVALLLWHDGLPRICRWGFATAMVIGFVAYFPFRDVLP